MSASGMTLADYYRESGIKDLPAFAKFIRMNHTPFASQRRALTLCVANTMWGLYDETGSGKSIPALATALYYVGFGNRVVIVTLPILLQQIKENLFEEFIGADKYVTAHILQENPEKRRKLFDKWKADNSWPQFMIMTYEMFATASEWQTQLDDKGEPALSADKAMFHPDGSPQVDNDGVQIVKKGRPIKQRAEFIWQTLEAANYNVVLADEVQKIRGTEGIMYKRIKQYVGEPSEGKCAFIPMTGTPMYTGPFDAYALINLTNPGAYEDIYHFQRKHGVFKKIRLKEPIKTKKGREITSIKKLIGYQRIEELNRNLYRKGSRTLKSQIPELAGLKDPIIKEIPVELHPKHLELYRRLMDERFLEVGEDEIISALQEQELRQKVLQIVTCPELFCAPGEAPPNHIIATCVGLLEDVIDDSKVVMFANYRNSVELLRDELAAYNPVVIYGGMSVSAREAARDRFLHDPKCRLLVANAEAAGAGLNLQHVSHTVIFAEPTSVPGRFKQAMDRIVRPGQAYECMVYIIKALKTVSPKATKEMLRRDTDIMLINRDRKSLRHYYEMAA